MVDFERTSDRVLPAIAILVRDNGRRFSGQNAANCVITAIPFAARVAFIASLALHYNLDIVDQNAIALPIHVWVYDEVIFAPGIRQRYVVVERELFVSRFRRK